MTFEQELKRTFDTLSSLLEVEVARQVRDALDARPEPSPAIAGLVPGSSPALHDATQGDAQLLDAIRAIDAARSLSDVLDALTIGAAQFATRVAVLLRRSGRWQPWRIIGGDDTVDPAALGDAAHLSIVIGGETIGAVSADEESPALEILTRHASRALEAMTAFKTARALARADAQAADEPNADQDDASARRYAKLLVSEIKLYHERDVVLGRRERDLASRLGGEIARARTLYEQRVPAQVRQRADFFHDELVRTLADGDGSLLEVGT